MVSRELRGSHGEGLRGLFDPGEGDHGRLYWWPARAATHQDGRSLLGMCTDRRSGDVLEVEANADRDGTVYFQFGMSQEEASSSPLIDAFLLHPTVSGQIGGCLARNGRIVVIDADGSIRLSDGIPGESPHDDLRRRRLAAWDRIAADADAWARSRAATTRDGRAMPDRRSLATLRAWLRHAVHMRGSRPAPRIDFEGDSITATWRGCDLYARITFEAGTMSMRTVENGRWREEGPVDVSTTSRMWRRSLHPNGMERMDDRRTMEPRP